MSLFDNIGLGYTTLVKKWLVENTIIEYLEFENDQKLNYTINNGIIYIDFNTVYSEVVNIPEYITFKNNEFYLTYKYMKDGCMFKSLYLYIQKIIGDKKEKHIKINKAQLKEKFPWFFKNFPNLDLIVFYPPCNVENPNIGLYEITFN